MKKLVSIILTTVMLLSAIITVNAASFKDVKSSDWYYSSVNYVADKGIMQGTSSTKFSPKSSFTRAMGVTLLYRVAESPSVSDVNIPFTDVKNGQWYTDAVKWAYDSEIVNGRTENTFVPNGDITRAEFAAILYRYMTFASLVLPEKRSGDVADAAKIPSYARDAVAAMYKAEIINGRDGGVFDPNAKITRAEAAAMIERFNKSAEKEATEDDGKLNVVFIGNSITLCENTAGHFEALSEGAAECTDFSKNGYELSGHLILFENIKPWADQCRNADIVIFQEYGGGFPPVGENTELQELNESYHIGGYAFCRGENIMGRFIELFGDGTDYYSYACNISSGLMKYDEYVGFDGSIRQSTNEAFLKAKEIIREQYGFEHIYVTDIAPFEPELGLTSKNTFPDYVHPTPLMAYCAALTLYCKIFDVPTESCNNGLLTYDNIPGETVEEKDAFMVRVKAEIQILLDMQK